LQTTKKEETEETQRENNKGNKKKHKEEKEEIPNMLYQRIVGLCLVLGLFVQGSMGASAISAHDANQKVKPITDGLGKVAKDIEAEKERQQGLITDLNLNLQAVTAKIAPAQDPEKKQLTLHKTYLEAVQAGLGDDKYTGVTGALAKAKTANALLDTQAQSDVKSDKADQFNQAVAANQKALDALSKPLNEAKITQRQAEVKVIEGELNKARAALKTAQKPLKEKQEEKPPAPPATPTVEQLQAAVTAANAAITDLEKLLTKAYEALKAEINTQLEAATGILEAKPANGDKEVVAAAKAAVLRLEALMDKAHNEQMRDFERRMATKQEGFKTGKRIGSSPKKPSAGPKKQTTSTSYETTTTTTTTTTSAAPSSFISGFIAAVVSANLIFALLFA
jgi:hypothetical protein